MTRKQRRELTLGLAFLAPNILGFLAFTIVPLVFSLALAFSNWDLKLHNMYKDEPIRFMGWDNFVRLLSHPDFWRFLGNTLFLMMGIPLAIAGSLCAALLLSRDLRGGSRPVFLWLFAGAVLIASMVMLTVVGAGAAGLTVLLSGVACGFLVSGVMGGSTVYRTLFYIPHFTSGVATFILWKKLYNPYTGPINNFLARPLAVLSGIITDTPADQVQEGLWVCFGLILLLFVWGARRLRLMWLDGDLGWLSALPSTAFLVLPAVMAAVWSPNHTAGLALPIAAAVVVVWQCIQARQGQVFRCVRNEGLGTGLMVSVTLMVGELILLGLGIACYHLPAAAAASAGLQPPEWLTQYHWAKPAIMIMGFWGAIGSNNMLLYLAGLSNIPTELYEAADVDGATWYQEFWHVTWPQLAPTTFFIVIMSVIAGLQGGFEMARTMTKGGPAGATTTLSYFIYTEGFETGRLGYSSAVAWTLFVMVFVLTLFNWRFGNRYVND